MCQIKDQKSKWSSSPLKTQSSVKVEDDDFFGGNNDGAAMKDQKRKCSSSPV